MVLKIPSFSIWKNFNFGRRLSFSRKSFINGSNLILFYLVFILNLKTGTVMATECMTRKYYAAVSYLEIIHINRTIKCDMYFQWTVADFCCYDKYDRFDKNPFCCYSETYKLVLAVTFICLVLFIGTFTIFFCWVYNLPHHLLFLLTCGKFHLNSWLLKNKNGPYVDPSFYAGEPFWARGAEIQPYPLRPMPPKIFYPAPPPKLKYRWDMSNCDIPLFIIASRQFTRNPYSARPQDRGGGGGGYHHNHHSTGVSHITSTPHPSGGTAAESRRSSLQSNNYNGTNGNNGGEGDRECGSHSHVNYINQVTKRDSSSAPNGLFRRGSSALSGKSHQNPPFKVNLDEGEAKAELKEALKVLEEGTEGAYSEEDPTPILNPITSQINNSLRGREQRSSLPTSSSSSLPGSGNNTKAQPVQEGEEGEEEEEEDEDLLFDLRDIRPNTTGGSGLDQYGNYVSQQQTMNKPNTALLNQQLNNLRLPVYSMPGVHTGNVLNTVQNYHVVSSNLGNPMETILEDDHDSLGDEFLEAINDLAKDVDKDKDNPVEKNNSSIKSVSSSVKDDVKTERKAVNVQKSQNGARPPLKRRATSIAAEETTRSSSPQIFSAMDHVVLPTATTRAVVPFTPTLPGSLYDMDTSTHENGVKRDKQRKEIRRNSVI